MNEKEKETPGIYVTTWRSEINYWCKMQVLEEYIETNKIPMVHYISGKVKKKRNEKNGSGW